MVHSRKLKSNNLLSKTKKILRDHIKLNSHLVIALSGGVDSVVLLHLLVALSKELQFTLSAVHVNHGISCNAIQWSKFCCNLCRHFGIPITVSHLKITKNPGISLEEIARIARYQVFNHLRADYVVLAQHLDDQAETFLLQLLRGAGVKGLGGMPVIRTQQSDIAPLILRPLLEFSRNQIEEYARQNDLTWIEDESNQNITFNRNFLRHKILPMLGKRYPNYRKTLLRTSRHLAAASNLLDDLAKIDEQHCVVCGRLQVERLRNLSHSRAKNLLRYTFSQQGIILPSTVKLEDILRQLLSSRKDAQLHISFGNIEIRCFKGAIYLLARESQPETTWQIPWQGEKQLFLKGLNGTINFINNNNNSIGINLQKLLRNPVTFRLRLGGERFSPDCKRPRRSLKNLLQEAAIPPWERKKLPLLFSGDQLVWVPGIGIDCAFQAKPQEPSLIPIWQPNS